MALTLGSKTFFVPGAYAISKIIYAGGNALPVFNVGVIIAKQMSGLPYTVGIGESGAAPLMSAGQFIKGYSDLNSFKQEYGNEGDNEGATAFQYAKKAGAGTIFFIGARPTTPATGIIVGDPGTTTTLTFDTIGKVYGAHANDISLTISEDKVHTIIPPKNITYLTQDATATKTIHVKNTLSYRAGDKVYLANCPASPGVYITEQMTIESVNQKEKTITFTAQITKTYNLTNTPHIFQEDLENQEISGVLDTDEKLQEFYSNSKYLNLNTIVREEIDVNREKIFIGNLESTRATSPEPTATDWQSIADNFQRWNEEFAMTNKVYLRLICLVDPDATNHIAYTALATNLRTLNKPIQIISGCDLGDYLKTGDDIDEEPKNRAFALNTDEIQLAGFGFDGYAAYLSYAPYLFGLRLSNEINHNQTLDTISGITSVEKAFGKDDPELEAYIKNGVMAIMQTKNGYKIVQGINTYQNQSITFDPNTGKTYLVMLRDLADFDLRMQIEILEELSGADGVTREVVAAAIQQSSDTLKNTLHYISNYEIMQITKVQNAWKVKRKIYLDSPTDFIGLENYIVVDAPI